MNPLTRWRTKRNAAWWARWRREHRWDALATYNSERHRGVLHTPEYDALMAEEQAAFNTEHQGAGNVFPFDLPSR